MTITVCATSLAPSKSMARCCRGTGCAIFSNLTGSRMIGLTPTVLLAMVAISARRVRKLRTGKPSSVSFVLAGGISRGSAVGVIAGTPPGFSRPPGARVFLLRRKHWPPFCCRISCKRSSSEATAALRLLLSQNGLELAAIRETFSFDQEGWG